jgi:glutamyl/glutaminyl-tRNA synthetase
LALLGWSHPEEKEIFSLDEFIRLFHLTDVNPVGPVFDITKLRWMNQQYIQNLSDEDLEKRLTTFFQAKNLDHALVRKLLPLVKTRMETLKDFWTIAEYFFTPIRIPVRNDTEKQIANVLIRHLTDLGEWNNEMILVVLKSVLEEFSIRMPVLYYIFTGKEKGLPLPESLEILGKESTIEQLQQFVK